MIRRLQKAFAAFLLLSLSTSTQAAEVDGAWANKVGSCSKVFRKTGNRISVMSNDLAYGKWFILEENHVRGRLAACRINHRKQDGSVVHLIAYCRRGVAIHDMQFSLKIIDENNLKQIFPGLPEVEIEYERCRL